jgi:hypothetical protein
VREASVAGETAGIELRSSVRCCRDGSSDKLASVRPVSGINHGIFVLRALAALMCSVFGRLQLAPGRYQLVLSAHSAGGSSRLVSLSMRVI